MEIVTEREEAEAQEEAVEEEAVAEGGEALAVRVGVGEEAGAAEEGGGVDGVAVETLHKQTRGKDGAPTTDLILHLYSLQVGICVN